MSRDRDIESREVLGFRVIVDLALGHMIVEHDGSITWDQLQAIKNVVWGKATRAIEVYPASRQVVNTGNYRHLWRLGLLDFCPDLLGNTPVNDCLASRYAEAWAEAKE